MNNNINNKESGYVSILTNHRTDMLIPLTFEEFHMDFCFFSYYKLQSS